MSVQLRIARPVTDLARTVAMYKRALGLEEIDGFSDHDGFDGTMLGISGTDFHLEFTFCHGHRLRPAPTQKPRAAPAFAHRLRGAVGRLASVIS